MVKTWLAKHWWVLAALPVALFVFSFTIGRYPMQLDEFFETIWFHFVDPTQIADPRTETVLFNIRIPRVLTVVVVGAGLAVAGASYQGMFHNPLVSPDILGASAGAAFGAGLGILTNQSVLGIQILAFIGSLLAVFLATQTNRLMNYDPILALVLGGLLIKTLFDAGLSSIKFLADPDNQLPSITFWLIGTFSDTKARNFVEVLVPFAVALAILFFNRRKLNVLAFGEDEARALGVNTRAVRIQVIVACTMITASSVSVAGQIGWIGLIVPHLGRAITGPNYLKLLPLCAILGASFLLVCDNLCRNVLAVELPIGILTSLLGVPFFLIIFKQRSKGWA